MGLLTLELEQEQHSQVSRAAAIGSEDRYARNGGGGGVGQVPFPASTYVCIRDETVGVDDSHHTEPPLDQALPVPVQRPWGGTARAVSNPALWPCRLGAEAEQLRFFIAKCVQHSILTSHKSFCIFLKS